MTSRTWIESQEPEKPVEVVSSEAVFERQREINQVRSDPRSESLKKTRR